MQPSCASFLSLPPSAQLLLPGPFWPCVQPSLSPDLSGMIIPMGVVLPSVAIRVSQISLSLCVLCCCLSFSSFLSAFPFPSCLFGSRNQAECTAKAVSDHGMGPGPKNKATRTAKNITYGMQCTWERSCRRQDVTEKAGHTARGALWAAVMQKAAIRGAGSNTGSCFLLLRETSACPCTRPHDLG